MKLCKCGAPVEAERYSMCKPCWWNQDPRNPNKIKPKRMQYLRNKKLFSHRGVIFELEDGAVRMNHWPYCGMDAKTTRRFAEWLLKRADDMEKK